MNSDFEIQAGKVLWASEDDKNKYNMEEWFGRANLAFFTQSKNFDGKSFYVCISRRSYRQKKPSLLIQTRLLKKQKCARS